MQTHLIVEVVRCFQSSLYMFSMFSVPKHYSRKPLSTQRNRMSCALFLKQIPYYACLNFLKKPDTLIRSGSRVGEDQKVVVYQGSNSYRRRPQTRLRIYDNCNHLRAIRHLVIRTSVDPIPHHNNVD